jgi:phage shock protein PspC (stress-responsive transcriptional regulator)
MSIDPERTLVATPPPRVVNQGSPRWRTRPTATRIDAMTETQNPPPGPPPGPSTGVDREHLRNYERLTRSTTDRKVAGVAGGLGRHLNIDPTVLRVLFVVLCFFGGAGFLLYGAAWLLVPEDGATQGKISTSPATRNGLLIAAGVVAALILLGNSWNGVGFPWPVLIVGVAVLVYVLVRDQRPSGSSGSAGGGWVGGGSTYPPAEGTPTAQQAAPTYAAQAQGPGGGGGDEPPPPWLASPQPTPAYRPPSRKRGPLLFGPTLALVAVALGALGLVDAAGGAVVDSAYPALALAVVGVMLVVGAFVGRAGGLILLGLVAAFALAVTSAVGGFRGLDFHDGQQISVAPATAGQVRSSYDLTSGRAVVDLSDVRNPDALDGRTIEVDGRAGELVVVLPDGVRSDVSAHIDGPGQIDLPDHSSGGFDTDLDGTYGSGRSTVTLDTRLSAGHIDVRSAR